MIVRPNGVYCGDCEVVEKTKVKGLRETSKSEIDR